MSIRNLQILSKKIRYDIDDPKKPFKLHIVENYNFIDSNSYIIQEFFFLIIIDWIFFLLRFYFDHFFALVQATG